MCGFAGVYSDNKISSDEYVPLVRNMTNSLAHRGPDGGNLESLPNFIIGHRRLKIIDTSDNASQPMWDYTKTLLLAFNGEIYNYLELKKELKNLGFIFKSLSDSEVILAAYKIWGEDGLDRLEGIFAFSIYDLKKQKLILMRDRLGVKPLYYCVQNNILIFASEIKGILASNKLNRNINTQALSEYLVFGAAHDNRTFYKDILQVGPGCRITFSKNSHKEVVWWNIEKSVANKRQTLPPNISELRQIIDSSISRQLISDVPIGIFLSSGIDSGLIASSVSQTNKDLVCYTASFEGREDSHEEVKRAKNLAKFLNLKHQTIKIGNSGLKTLVHKLARNFDEPFGDAANIPILQMCQSLKEYATVVLQGDGGDEIFGGYDRYLVARHRRFLKEKFSFLSFLGSKKSSRHQRLIGAVFHSEDNEFPGYISTSESATNSIFDLFLQDHKYHLLSDNDPFLVYKNAFARFKSFEPTKRMMLIDLVTMLPSVYFPKVDRASMLAGVEARVPLLDESILDYALQLPSKYLIQGFTKKALLKKAFKDRFPRNYLTQPKKGFAVPYGKWIRNELSNDIKDTVLDDKFLNSFSLDKSKILTVLNRENNNYFGHDQIWKLYQLSLWTSYNHNF